MDKKMAGERYALKLLREANEVYPDAQIAAYFDLDTGVENHTEEAGDTLALFIGREILDTGEDREMAIMALECALEELQFVIAHLSKKL